MAGGRPKVASTLALEDTSANALVVGGAPGATSGTGGIKAGAVVAANTPGFSGNGTGLTGFTDHGVLYGNGASAVGITAAGTTGQVLTATTGGNPSFQTFTGPLSLMGCVTGTDATNAATNVATVAISGLTLKDRLLVVITHSSAGAATIVPRLYNSTDSVVIQLLNGNANVGTNSFAQDVVLLSRDLSATTKVIATSFTVGGIAGLTNGVVNGTASTFTTVWTGSWTLALRTGTGGVDVGGTYSFNIAAWKFAGQ